MTLAQALPLLGLKRARAMQLIAEGKLRAERDWIEGQGPRLMVTRDEIQRFVGEREREAAERIGKPGGRVKLPKKKPN